MENRFKSRGFYKSYQDPAHQTETGSSWKSQRPKDVILGSKTVKHVFRLRVTLLPVFPKTSASLMVRLTTHRDILKIGDIISVGRLIYLRYSEPKTAVARHSCPSTGWYYHLARAHLVMRFTQHNSLPRFFTHWDLILRLRLFKTLLLGIQRVLRWFRFGPGV